MERTLVIGDLHGCIDELHALLTAASFEPGKDRLVFLGDFMDRGPDGPACVRFARENGALAVLGNHDEKHLRWRRHEAARKATGKKNPMRPLLPDRLEANARLSEEDVEWLRKLPLTLDLGSNFVAVHAGLLPGLPIKEQPDKVLRVRWVDAEGGFVGLAEDSLDRPEGAFDWQDRWDGSVNVVHGHAVVSEVIRRTRPQGVEIWSIDTGCVFGGYLTAFIPEAREIIQVPAPRAYEHRGDIHE